MAIIVHPKNKAAPTNLIRYTANNQIQVTKNGEEIMKW
jgi:hypothetical protein